MQGAIFVEAAVEFTSTLEFAFSIHVIFLFFFQCRILGEYQAL